MSDATIFVVDDEAVHRAFLTDLLTSEGYAVIAVDSARAALEILASTPDVLLVDVMMPEMDGIELCRRLKGQKSTRLIPFVLVTGLTAPSDRLRGIEAGADDFLSKPIQPSELLARVRSLVRLKRYTDQLDHAEAVLYSLARGVEAKDPALEGHCERLARYAVALGTALDLRPDALEDLRRGAVLHDLGKIGIPDTILSKPGPLTPEEWTVMREHPVIGERICQPLHSLRAVLPMIRHHHERWDGSGYPDGLMGSAIPLPARILQVVDIFDALTTVRPYRNALSPAEALCILREETVRGLWDVRLVKEFERLWESGALEAAGSRPHHGQTDGRASASAAPAAPPDANGRPEQAMTSAGPPGIVHAGLGDERIAFPAGSAGAPGPSDAPVILIVEDEQVEAEFFRDTLRAEGYGVLQARSGVDALAVLSNPACPVDLVLLDLILPDVHGLQLLGPLRTVAGVRLPVIIATGRGTPADRAAAIKGEADDFLLKPVRPEELVSRVRMALVRQSLVRERQELAALCRMARAVNSSLHLNAVLDRGLEHALTALGADAGTVWLRVSEEGRLSLKRHRGIPEALVPRLEQASPVPERLDLRSPLVVDLGAAQPSSYPGPYDELRLFREAGYHRAALIPLQAKTAVVGLLGIFSRRPRAITEEARPFLAAIGDHLSVAVENAHLHGEAISRSLRDPLTGLPNRSHFMESLGQEVARVRRSPRPLALLLLDLDHFKQINDVWGHATGDEVLQQIGMALRAPLRVTDLLARYGGEEFAVLLPETSRSMALRVAERLRLAVAKQAFASGRPGEGLHLTISLGMATVPEDGSAPEVLLDWADRALYRAKGDGRNCVRTATEDPAEVSLAVSPSLARTLARTG